MSYDVRVEKIIKRPASDVFEGLREGLLFANCGVESSTMKIDFRVGGKYQIFSRVHAGKSNGGEFLEIIPNKKVVFTWCQSFTADKKADTEVTIELFEEKGHTRMVLVHTGFTAVDLRDAHEKGWASISNDFANQITDGELRILTGYETSAEKLSAIYLNELKGDLAEAVENKKAKLTIREKENGHSYLEIIHSGLTSIAEQKKYFAQWETMTKKLKERV